MSPSGHPIVDKWPLSAQNREINGHFLLKTPVKQGGLQHHRSPPVLNPGTALCPFYYFINDRMAGWETINNDRMAGWETITPGYTWDGHSNPGYAWDGHSNPGMWEEQ